MDVMFNRVSCRQTRREQRFSVPTTRGIPRAGLIAQPSPRTWTSQIQRCNRPPTRRWRTRPPADPGATISPWPTRKNRWPLRQSAMLPWSLPRSCRMRSWWRPTAGPAFILNVRATAPAAYEEEKPIRKLSRGDETKSRCATPCQMWLSFSSSNQHLAVLVLPLRSTDNFSAERLRRSTRHPASVNRERWNCRYAEGQ